MSKTRHLVKVQAELFGSPELLIYNESRSFQIIVEDQAHADALREHGLLRSFWEIDVEGDAIEFVRCIEEQGW